MAEIPADLLYTPEHEYVRKTSDPAIVEIGTNAPGEIAQLTGVARPDVGIVTCVAPAHLEGLGSLGRELLGGQPAEHHHVEPS